MFETVSEAALGPEEFGQFAEVVTGAAKKALTFIGERNANAAARVGGELDLLFEAFVSRHTDPSVFNLAVLKAQEAWGSKMDRAETLSSLMDSL